MRKTFLFTLLLLLTGLFQISAQEARPKVGLVLSGGGAKGLAHIGVLKVLEEEGIVPDFITGTSMGSIIGGLYAIGYTAEELDSIVNSVSWSNLLSDQIPLSSISPQEKEDYNRYQVEFNITRDGLEIPSGLVRGQKISELISRLSWHVADVGSFDNLPIPFRCVAADLISGNQYIFDHGNLTTALRASMSIPSVFSPVRLDSMLLVDGGILNNFPVYLCKKMGADIIIGVNVGYNTKPGSKGPQTLPEILMASATIGGNMALRRAIKRTDLLISPPLEKYNTASFSDTRNIIRIGEEAAREHLDALRKLKAEKNIKSRPLLQVDKSNSRTKVISRIQIHGQESTTQQFLLGNLRIQPGDSITSNAMRMGIERAMGTRYFENIAYHFEPLDEGYMLVLNVEESNPAETKFSLHYDNEYKAGLMANLTIRNLFGNSSRTSLTTDISETPRLNLSHLNYMGEKHIAAAKTGFTYENNNLPVYLDNGSKYGTFKQRYTSVYAGFLTNLGTYWQMETTARYTHSTLQNRSGFSDIFYAGVERFGNTFLSSRFDFNYNSLNRRYFPVRGSRINLYYRFNFDAQELYKGSDNGKELVAPLTDIPNRQYFSLGGDWKKYFPVSSRFTPGIRLSGQFTNKEAPLLDLTFIGGLPFNNRSNEVHFIGYSFREKLVEDYALGEIDLRYRLLQQIHLNVQGGILFSTINLPEQIEPIGLDKTETVYGYGLMLAYDSFLGPVQLGAGSNSTDHRVRWYFNFGFNF
ncbi:patatin-like phospholipase family protein [Marinilabilia sp.]|uniref:patatin-like phospholipase family protein n=1 Tax=Marinilabilia sp. TaxID=2021252 RepID=UPI0025C5A658|nr:patatin-like phospholipase family protein [Marinilabilia sp.]